MAHSELENFIVKFKGLLRSEKNANLNLKSEDGKLFITLSVEEKLNQHPPVRVGPSRQRRKERRAAARAEALAPAEEAVKDVSENEILNATKETGNTADPVATTEEVLATAATKAVFVQPQDEIENISTGKSDPKESVEFCSNISVIPIRHVNPGDDAIKNTITMKMEEQKVKVHDIIIYRSNLGTFERSDVKIEPIAGKLLDNIDFGFSNCRVLPFFGLRVL